MNLTQLPSWVSRLSLPKLTSIGLRTLVYFGLILGVALMTFLRDFTAQAQSTNLVAHLQVDKAGVEVQRVNTATWKTIQVESLVGVGDSIRTGDQGNATITFSSEAISLQLRPNSTVTITTFNSTDGGFDLLVDVLTGFTMQTARTKLSEKTHYRLNTPAFQVQITEGISELRVEGNGRSAALIGGVGQMVVTDSKNNHATVLQHTGLRADKDGTLSDVIPAVSFPTLDVGLDGCPSILKLDNDVQQNVRSGADLKFPIIGNLDTQTTVQVMGVTQTKGWSRIRFRGGFGWVRIDKLPVDEKCVGLRVFANSFGPEDTSHLDDIPTATASASLAATEIPTEAATATPSATAKP